MIYFVNLKLYFEDNIDDLSICETLLHHELVNLNQLRKELLRLTYEIEENNFGKKELQVYIKNKILSINSVKDLYNYFLIVNNIENNE